MQNLGSELEDDHKYRESENIFRELIDLRRKTYGAEDPRTLTTSGSVAGVLMDENRLPEARKMLEDTIAVQGRVLGSDNTVRAGNIYNLACIAARSKRPQDALSLLSEAVEHNLSAETLIGIDQDTDLKSLHGNPQFAAIVARAKLLATTPAAQKH